MATSDGSDIVYEVPVAEAQINAPVYCSGMALATKHGDTIHAVLFIDQPAVSGRFERIANLRIVMDAEGWAQTLQVISRAIRGDAPEERGGEK